MSPLGYANLYLPASMVLLGVAGSILLLVAEKEADKKRHGRSKICHFAQEAFKKCVN